MSVHFSVWHISNELHQLNRNWN